MAIVANIVSAIGVGVFMSHFWWPAYVAGHVLWGIAGFCAIFSIYSGIIHRAKVEDNEKKAVLTASAIIGCLILLGLTFSAIFLLVPAM